MTLLVRTGIRGDESRRSTPLSISPRMAEAHLSQQAPKERIEKVDSRNSQQPQPIPLQQQPIWDRRMLHRVLLIRLGLLHFESEIHQKEGRDDTEAEGDAPDDFEPVHAKDPEEDEDGKVTACQWG